MGTSTHAYRKALGRMLSALAFCIRLFAQEATEGADIARFNSEVQLAVIQFQVKQHDRYVSGLSSSDFRLLQDGRNVPITFFEGVDIDGPKTPVDVILLLDSSGSVMGNRLLNEELFRTNLLDGLPDVYLSIYHFASRLVRMTGPTRDPARLREAFEGVVAKTSGEAILPLGPPSGASLIFEAVAESIIDVGRIPTATRKLLVVVSDGQQQGGSPDPKKVGELARNADIRIYPVVVGSRWHSPLASDGSAAAKFAGLGKATGGTTFRVAALDDNSTKGVIERLADRIRHTYVVGFKPEDHTPPHRHELEVLLKSGRSAKILGGRRFVIH